jgi:hypothetical protein
MTPYISDSGAAVQSDAVAQQACIPVWSVNAAPFDNRKS